MRAATRKSTFVARQLRVGMCLTLGLAGFAALAPVQGAGAVSGPVTLFDSSTTGTGFFASAATVPANVCFVTVSADGGHGGNILDEFTGAVGGVAASVTARVGVTPGDGLAAEVGGAGGSVEPNARSSAGGGPGGVGGGGGGGGVNADGAGGGGASAVSSSATGSLVVAGGGGGAANRQAGGAGGLPDGGNGSGLLPGSGGLASGVGGAGAPAAAGINPLGGGGGVSTGGLAGSLPSGGNGTGVNAVPSVGGGGGGGEGNSTVTSAPGGNGGSSDTGQGGTAGAFGGAGGAGNTNGGNGGLGVNAGGAGGGGGIGFGGGGGGSATGGGGGFGGGGGGGNNSGGGGGSSHVISTATSSAFAASTRAGDGQVTITYDPTADMCPPTPINVTVSGSQAYGNTPNTFTRTDNGPPGVLSGTVSCTTVNGTPISPTLPVGLYRIDGASCSGLTATGNYQVSYTGGDFAVSKAGQGIHFPKPVDLPYGTKTTTLSATVTSNSTVEFNSSTIRANWCSSNDASIDRRSCSRSRAPGMERGARRSPPAPHRRRGNRR